MFLNDISLPLFMKFFSLDPIKLNCYDLDKLDIYISEQRLLQVLSPQDSIYTRAHKILTTKDFENVFSNAKELIASANLFDKKKNFYSMSIVDMDCVVDDEGFKLVHGFENSKTTSLADLLNTNSLSKDIVLVNVLKKPSDANDFIIYTASRARFHDSYKNDDGVEIFSEGVKREYVLLDSTF